MKLEGKSYSFILRYHKYYDSPFLVSFLYTIFVMIIYNKTRWINEFILQAQYVVEELMQTFIKE